MKLKKLSLYTATLLFTSSALAHGYVEFPPSRAYQCNLGKNTDCGAVQWEPQSVEQASGFPAGTMPPDGQLASAGKANFAQLDSQSATRWVKSNIKSGKNNFTWHHSAPHRTANWRYYITKQNWDQNKPLTRSDFESQPFCQIEGNGQTPAVEVTHSCNVPERTGYQVIYAVWEIADTANSFYQAIDVDFGGASDETTDPSPWTTQLAGQLSGEDLHTGDKVIAHFFNASGEVHSLQTELTIASEAKGQNSQWSYDLAEAINTAHGDALRAGVKGSDGSIAPFHGVNQVYAPEGSTVQSVTLTYAESQSDDIAEESLSVANVNATKIANGKATVTFNASARGKMQLTATVNDHAGAEKGSIKQTVDNRSLTVSIPLTNVQAGHHMLRYSANNAQGATLSQGVIDLMLEESAVQPDPTPAPAPAPAPAGNYDYTFPDNLKSYTAGTKVMQPKNGKVYQCRPFPYSGYCVQWSQYATQFEPGTGSDWTMAWTEVSD